jgi:uncharacterized protein YbjQ (UPF0145 family)
MPFNKDALDQAKAYETSLDNFEPDDAHLKVGSQDTIDVNVQSFNLILTTTDSIPGKKVLEYKRIVFSSSSEMSSLGSGAQHDRLVRSTYAALKSLEIQAQELGANAVIGISIEANNSTGTGLTGGSSDSITATGTAVVIE